MSQFIDVFYSVYLVMVLAISMFMFVCVFTHNLYMWLQMGMTNAILKLKWSILLPYTAYLVFCILGTAIWFSHMFGGWQSRDWLPVFGIVPSVLWYAKTWMSRFEIISEIGVDHNRREYDEVEDNDNDVEVYI